jgi:phosphoribosyl 1,2-cyclic phosphodiesterase
MTVVVRSLSSGSNGNSVLVRSGRAAVLVDAGISLSRLATCLREDGIGPGGLRAICLTHEHTDHASNAVLAAARYGIPLICNAATYAALGAPDVAWIELPTGGALDLDDMVVRSFGVPHDAADPVGYRIEHRAASVAVATDLGHWNDEVVAALAASDMLMIEANHQRERLARCGYPVYLQRRICGARGHLSNAQTAELLVAVCRRDSRPRTVWLAHLSARSNTPELALAEVGLGLRQAGIGSISLAVAPRGRPGGWWRSVAAPIQRTLWDELAV